jgi:hypothetical protein
LATSSQSSLTTLRSVGKPARLLVELFLAAIWVCILLRGYGKCIANDNAVRSIWLPIVLLNGLPHDAVVRSAFCK